MNIFSFNMPLLDIALILILIYGGYKGYKRGLVMELLSIATLIITVWLLFYIVTNSLTGLQELIGIDFPRGVNFFTFFLIYIVIIIFINKIGRFIQKKINYSILDDFDNIAATVVGLLKYALYLSIIITLLSYIGIKPPQETIDNSIIYSSLFDFQKWVINGISSVFPSLGEIDTDIKQLFSPDKK